MFLAGITQAALSPSCLDLLFDQHLASLVACALYGVARAYDIPLSFRRIYDALIKHFPMLSHCIFRQVLCHISISSFPKS